jgi:hypothetical protein
MKLDDLLAALERSGIDTPDTSCNAPEVSAKAASIKACTPDTPATLQNGHGKRETGKGDAVIEAASRWWRFHYPSGGQKEACYSPLATRAAAMAGEPNAITAEPFERTCQKPAEPLGTGEATAISAWLRQIGETDEEISRVLKRCDTDADARAGFLRSGRTAINQGY